MGSQPWFHTLAAVTGWTLAAAGILLLLWALVWDRSRGRKRCPKCWYDMSGAPPPGADAREHWTCPECGRDIRGAARLHRTRRRWRWAPASVVLLAAGWVAACTPAIIATGWWAAAPRPVLIAMIPWVERDGPHNWQMPPSKLVAQINARLFRGRWNLARLWWPERWLMGRVCVATLNRERGDYTKALAARGLVLTRDAPVAIVTPSGQGHVVLARSGLVYARATSYFDRGMVKGSIGVRDEKPFVTAFVRSERRFRFEFLSGHPHERKLSMRYVVWADGDDIRSWWNIQPEVKQFPSLSMALGGPTGVSRGSAIRTPSMLLADQFTSGFLFADGVEYVGDTDIDGHPCRRVDIKGPSAAQCFWIDAETFLIRRIEQKGQFPQTTTYDPKINIELGREWFQFDPEHPELSPLQDERAAK